MATQAGQVAEGGEEQTIETTETETPETTIETPGEDDDPPPPDPVEELAKGMGWRPKEQFRGDQNLWKPAADYIRAGAEIQKSVSRDLKDLRHTVDSITKTNAAIVQQTIESEREKLVQKYNKAVEDGDAQTSYRVGQEIGQLNGRARELAQPTPTPQAPDPDTEAWVRANSWYTQDPLARNLALAVAEQYAQAGHAAPLQLAAAEREVKKAYPHLFSQPANQPPGTSTPGARGGSGAKQGTTFNDMPAEAKKVAKDMAERGVIPNVEAYAKQYWQNQGKRA